MLLMEAKHYLGLDLGADLTARTCFRKSLLMLASNFLVGTFFSSSRFCFASNDLLLQSESELDSNIRHPHEKFGAFQHIVNQSIVRATYLAKPWVAAMHAGVTG